MTSSTAIKAIGIATTLIGAGVSAVSSWVEDKKMEEKIEEKVNEALAKRDNEGES